MSDSGWQYFDLAELQCRCGCGKALMDKNFMARVVAMRRELGFPFRVASAYRCPEYDAKIGGAGPHTTGQAMDLRISGHLAHALIASALRHGITGIGVAQKGPHESRFIHIDTVTNGPRPWIWSY